MISSGCSLAIAARTTCSTSLASRTLRVSTLACSKPREFGEGEPAAMDVHPAEFGAAMQGGKHLAGVEQSLCVERAFQSLLLIKVDLAEHLGHQVPLLDTDAVFPREYAPKLDTDPQNIGAERLGSLHFPCLVRIVKDQRMQVAVARMKDVGYPQIVFSREITDARQR